MKAELVLIPCPGRGHLTPALEFAKLLVTRSQRLSITVLLIKFPLDQNLAEYADSLAASFASDRIKFVDISQSANPSLTSETNPTVFMERFIESHGSRVRSTIVSADGTPRFGLAGFVIDMVCMSLSDVASKLGVPTYVFWPSNAGFLALNLHLQIINYESFHLVNSANTFPGFTKPVPGSVLPSIMFNSSAPVLFRTTKRVRESRGVIVNTSTEIEPQALRALTYLPVYAVGPVLSHPENTVNSSGEAFSRSSTDAAEAVTAWLDVQHPASVLFLCFGSSESFSTDQLREIAKAIESAGVLFLWTLRQYSPDGKMAFATDNCANLDSVLPEGFMERTAGRGRVIRWAPQTAVLAHPAVGGFVSHCGWNSILESLWFGVPIAAWPLHSEQQLNAFQMVEELGVPVEVKMDFKFGFAVEEDNAALVSAEVIEAAIVKVMDGDSEIRKRVKEISVGCRNSVAHGGSSFSLLDRFVGDVFANLFSE